ALGRGDHGIGVAAAPAVAADRLGEDAFREEPAGCDAAVVGHLDGGRGGAPAAVAADGDIDLGAAVAGGVEVAGHHIAAGAAAAAGRLRDDAGRGDVIGGDLPVGGDADRAAAAAFAPRAADRHAELARELAAGGAGLGREATIAA